MENSNKQNTGRLAVLVLSSLLGIYVGLGLYWGFKTPLFSGVTIGMLSGVVAGLVIAGVGYYYSMVFPRSVAFIDETETELRKAIWPKSAPISPKTELWQAGIAVLSLMAILVVYTFLVDTAIQLVLSKILY